VPERRCRSGIVRRQSNAFSKAEAASDHLRRCSSARPLTSGRVLHPDRVSGRHGHIPPNRGIGVLCSYLAASYSNRTGVCSSS
jgi:hypothetical protein